jgi:hypothetical protein
MESDKKKVHPFIQHLIYTAAIVASAVFLLTILFSLTESPIRQCLLSDARQEEDVESLHGSFGAGRVANPWYADLIFGIQGWYQ